jgi:hypothetical protein
MSKHLVRRSASSCLAIGRRILPKLLADPRLAEAASALQAGQESLEAKHTAYEDAVQAARSTTAARDQAYRGVEDRLREFGLNVLSMVRNNHGADSYLRYFPMGYGTAIREHPEQILEVTRVVLGKLAEETDPWLVPLRDRITAAHEAFLVAQVQCVEGNRGRNDAFAYLVAEKRRWIQSLGVSRLRAKEACLGDEAYVSVIFSPATIRRRAVVVEPAAGDASADTPAKVETPMGGSAPSPAPVLAAVPA